MFAAEPETIYCVVDNRVLLLGIDERYRHYMTGFESDFLLPQVEAVAEKLKVMEADVAIEGYYGLTESLTRYFKLMRALQQVSASEKHLISHMPEFQEVLRVTGSPIFGKPQDKGFLLPQRRDPVSRALLDTRDQGWDVQKVVNRAYEVAMDSNEISLVGLAARKKDSLVITAFRESVVLYAEKLLMGMYHGPKIEYIWKVDDEFAAAANCFIEEFNSLLPKDSYLSHGISKTESENSGRFYSSYSDNIILGRCANLGYKRSSPIQYYHWAITTQNDELALDEFWDTELWTTDKYRSKQKQLGWKFLKDEIAK